MFLPVEYLCTNVPIPGNIDIFMTGGRELGVFGAEPLVNVLTFYSKTVMPIRQFVYATLFWAKMVGCRLGLVKCN